MNAELIRFLRHRWYDHLEPAIADFDQATRGKAGFDREFSTGVLLLGLLALMVCRQTPQVKFLYRQFLLMDAATLAEFGLTKFSFPSPKQMYTMLNAIKRWQQEGMRSADNRLQAVFDRLVPPSAFLPGTEPDDEGVALLDTTLVDAYTSKVGITTDKAKEGKASDPDARWRVHNDRKPYDEAKANGESKDGKEKKRFKKGVLGYAGVNVVRVVNNREVVTRCSVIRANENDAPVGIDLLLDDAVAHGTSRAIVDRGFSHGEAELQRLRDAGIPVTFDLAKDQLGVEGWLHGNPVVDGAVYGCLLPRSLYKIQHPGANATDAKKAAWRKKMERREKYLMPTNGTADTLHGVRVQSGAARGKWKCPDVPESYAKAPADAPECKGGHEAGKGCLMMNGTLRASDYPLTYQFPPFGSKAQRADYDRRGGVERMHSRFKNATGAHFQPGRFAFRGIEKFSVLYGLAAVATNLIPEWNAIVEAKAVEHRARVAERRRAA